MNEESQERLEAIQSTQMQRSPRSQISDGLRQHRRQIPLYLKDGEVNPEIDDWLDNQTKSDITGIDDVSPDTIKRARYGELKTKAERKLLAKVRDINAKRPQKVLEWDLSGNEEVIPLSQYKRWQKNKKRFDINRVDTVPESAVGYTSNVIRSKYLDKVKRAKYNRGMAVTTYGYFASGFTAKKQTPRNYIRLNRILKGSPTSQTTLAHETGHAVDYNLFGAKEHKPTDSGPVKSYEDHMDRRSQANKRFWSTKLAKGDKVYEDMKTLALKTDPVPAGASPSHIAYRHKRVELFADAFVGVVTDPKSAKKTSPAFTKQVFKENKGLSRTITTTRKKFLHGFVKRLKKQRGK